MKSLEGLPSEMKFLMAVGMTDFALQVCVAGIKAELLEKLRERLEWCRRQRQRLRGV
ncbi:MAG: hypothetical protein QXX59_09465 [Candidatus Bathyarchaeia archaeon]